MVAPWLAWTTLFAPLAACVAIVLFGRRSKTVSSVFGIGGLAVSFLCAASLFYASLSQVTEVLLETSVPWITLPELSLEFGLLINPLSLLMSLVVTGVGLCIFVYSVGYMWDDSGFSRYFAYLSLFAFSMLGIVLANNFITLFMAWELVGASSYLLIGYWFEKPQAANAGKKAFLVNRIADFGFLIGILLVWSVSGLGHETRTLNFLELEERFHFLGLQGLLSQSTLALLGGLLFCGVIGKSAQFPLHVWLPDAMEGPTPVSALIHAATMVAAGVYLLARLFFIFSASPQMLQAITLVGGLTAFFAASLALVENDLKRVLAYSTLSQLGFMVMALGMGGYVAGMYHLTTHAFFKALLFLGAGCVIHALHTNNIWEMGGLVRSMPITAITFTIASAALCGLFPLSGFWSKDEILTLAYEHDIFFWVLGTVTAGLTAFYMGRVLCVAFFGPPHPHAHAHEAPRIMTTPLLVLTALSIFGGFLGLPHFIGRSEQGLHVEFNRVVAIVSHLAAFTGLGLAYLLYGRRRLAVALSGPLAWIYLILQRKYFVDDIYGWINRNVQQRLAILTNLFERHVIIGLWVNGIAKLTGLGGNLLRRAQTGKVQGYALTLLAGLSLLLYVSLVR